MAEEKYNIIFRNKEIINVNDYIKKQIEGIELISIILNIKEYQRHNHIKYEILDFLNNALNRKFSRDIYHLFITADFQSFLTDKRFEQNLRKPIQVCLLQDSIPSLKDSMSLYGHPLDSSIANLKNLISKINKKALFFLIITLFYPGRLREGLSKALQQHSDYLGSIDWE